MPVTHIRIIMGGADKEFAVDPQRAGRFTLQQLVTAAHGSLASEYNRNGQYDSLRGRSPKWIDVGDTVACDHVGFNYLSPSGVGGNVATTELRSARVRIGMVVSKSGKVPCSKREGAQGIGVDTNYGEAAWKCQDDSAGSHCGGRLGSGSVSSDEHAPVFKAAEVWVANMASKDYVSRVSPYRAFGSKAVSLDRVDGQPNPLNDDGGFLSYRVSRQNHVDNVEYGHISWNPRYTYSLFFKVRRSGRGGWFHHCDWDCRTVIQRGDDANMHSPTLRVNHKNSYISRYQGKDWTFQYSQGRSMTWMVSSRVRTESIGQRGAHFTLGRWHHIALIVDKHSMTTVIDGRIQHIKTFAASSVDP